jgi:hypothetical protein
MRYVGRIKKLIDEPQQFQSDPNKFHSKMFCLNKRAIFTHEILTLDEKARNLIPLEFEQGK